MTPGPRSGLSAETNVTPMIDVLLVLLVLLVIFMLIVPQLRRTIDAQLPDPGSDETAGAIPVVVVALGDGLYSIERTAEWSADAGLTPSALRARLVRRRAGSPLAAVIVRGAEGVRYGEVFSALDVARGAGFRTVALAPADRATDARK
jgi:biopolymer transport protein TolR